MDIALIRDGVCSNVAVFDTVEHAKEFFRDSYDFIIECPEYRGIGHRYIDGCWYNPQPQKYEGKYYFVKDMDVKAGDLVIDPSGDEYEALVDIELQQIEPSKLPEKYKLLEAEVR